MNMNVPSHKLTDDERKKVEDFIAKEDQMIPTDRLIHFEDWREMALSNICWEMTNPTLDICATDCIKSYVPSFDKAIPYIAMTLFDRFISLLESMDELPKRMPKENEDVALAALACLMITRKTREESFCNDCFLQGCEIDSFKNEMAWMVNHIEGTNGCDIDLHTSAFDLVDYFAEKFEIKKGFRKMTLNNLILKAKRAVTFSKYKPSVMAAAALISATQTLYPEHAVILVDSLRTKCTPVDRIEMLNCSDSMTAMCLSQGIVIEGADGLECRRYKRLKVEAGQSSSSSTLQLDWDQKVQPAWSLESSASSRIPPGLASPPDLTSSLAEEFRNAIHPPLPAPEKDN